MTVPELKEIAKKKAEELIKKKAEELIKKNFQSTEPIWKFKKKYGEYKELFELGEKLVNPDTRDATIFKEALKIMLKKAGKLIGQNLMKSPYYVLNQKGLEALFEAITAMDTINNARQLVADGEDALDKLTPKVADFRTHYRDKHTEYYDAIKTQFDKLGWRGYLQEINMDRFWKDTRAEAEDEINNALQMAQALLTNIRPIVDKIFITAPTFIADYAALAAAGGSIVASEKTAEAKVAKLAGSKSTISGTFGKAEQSRQQTERALAGLYNKKSGGKSLAARVTELFNDSPSYVVRDWNDIVYWCSTELVLQIGVPGGGGWELPWNLPLPKA